MIYKTVFIVSNNQNLEYWIEKSKTETVFYLDGEEINDTYDGFEFKKHYKFLELGFINDKGIVSLSNITTIFNALDWAEDWLVEEAIIQLEDKLYKVIYWKEDEKIQISKVFHNNKLVEDFDETVIKRLIKNV